MSLKDYSKLRKFERQELRKIAQKVPYDKDGNIVMQLKDNEIKSSLYIDGEDDSISFTSDFENYLCSFRDSFASEPICVNLDLQSKVETKQKFEMQYQSFFKYKIIKMAKELKNNLRNIIVTFLLGLIVIVGTILMEVLIKNDWKAANIILEIVAWVFIWESCDMLFFQRPKMRREQLKNYHMYTAKFVNDKIQVDVKDVGYKDKSSLNK